ncbi:MAG TPA: glycosyltransferase [Polyangiaceae bacterium]|nr:glycosyltransferase [Polyangiaceae bacterium]
MSKTLIVVPCFNEAQRLDVAAYAAFTASEQSIDVLFVDDGSSDATVQVLQSLCSQNPERLRWVSLATNCGKGEAVRAGFSWAFSRSYPFIGYFDADLATPLVEASRMMTVFDDPRVHAVLGSRVALLGRTIARKRSRHYLGRIFATSASAVLGLAVYDTQCGAKIFRTTEFLQAVFREPFALGWIFDVEILARFLLLERYRGGPKVSDAVVEYPLRNWRDVAGSKLKLKDTALVGADLMKLWHLLHGPGAAGRAPEL